MEFPVHERAVSWCQQEPSTGVWKQKQILRCTHVPCLTCSHARIPTDVSSCSVELPSCCCHSEAISLSLPGRADVLCCTSSNTPRPRSAQCLFPGADVLPGVRKWILFIQSALHLFKELIQAKVCWSWSLARLGFLKHLIQGDAWVQLQIQSAAGNCLSR